MQNTKVLEGGKKVLGENGGLEGKKERKKIIHIPQGETP